MIVVPHGEVLLPSALNSWVPSIGCTGLLEMYSLHITEHEAPESSNTDDERFPIFPLT